MKLSEALKISQAVPRAAAEQRTYFLACGFLPLHLATFLTAHLRLRLPDYHVEVETGEYGNLAGNLTRISNSHFHAAAVALEWSDFDPRLGLRSLGGWGAKVLADIQDNFSQSAPRILNLIESAARTTPLVLCLPTLPLPPLSHLPASQAAAHDLFLRKALQEFAFKAAQLSKVRIVNQQRLDELSPLAERLDVKSDLGTGFPFRLTHASIVAELIAELIQPRPAKKGLITDLDDTVWRGILGEDGVTGISWDLDQRSHGHALYQQVLAALAESGVLIAVASRNDAALVAEAMAREDMILRTDQVFPLEVNWQQKSNSIGKILKAWNIGADAVVFVDDSPLELAEVKALYPEMECLLFPKNDDQAVYQLLEQLRDLFGRESVAEDSIRRESLRRAEDFHEETLRAHSLEEFLKGIEAELTFTSIDSQGEARAFELINKTNQFNLNGRRLSDVEFQAALRGPQAISLLVSYKDKFGPLGKIAVLLGRLEFPVLKVDTWVMSCRAFGRHIEHRCLDYLFEQWDLAAIELDQQQTDRNGPISEFLLQFSDDNGSELPGRIDRRTFMDKKPQLFHAVNGVSYA